MSRTVSLAFAMPLRMASSNLSLEAEVISMTFESAGFVFTAAVLVRVYWAFAGNRYAHWRALLPITRAQGRDLLDMLSFYTLRRRHPPRANRHNPLVALAYLAV